jgi:uncharacterized protein YqfB (UPF0267 family)
MTIKQLEKLIATRESKKSQVKIGDIREIIGIISDVIYADIKFMSTETIYELNENGKKRAKKKVKK